MAKKKSPEVAPTTLPETIESPAGAEVIEEFDLSKVDAIPADQATAEAVASAGSKTVAQETLLKEFDAVLLATAAIKAREDKGRIVLFWREEGPKIVANGLIEDAGSIVKRTYEIAIPEKTDLMREAAIADALAQMDQAERDHAIAACKKIPFIVDEAEHSILLRKAAKGRLEDMRQEMEETKAAAASSKKRYESAQEEFVLKAQEECVPDLYRGAAQITPPAAAQPEAAAEPAQPAAEPAPAVNEAWRDVSMDELTKHGCSGKLIEKMKEKGLDTLGKFQDHVNKNGEWWAKNLDCGIGAAKAKQIDEAYIAWIFENPTMAPPVKDMTVCEGCGKPRTTEVNGMAMCDSCAATRVDEKGAEAKPEAAAELPPELEAHPGAHVIVDDALGMVAINPDEGEFDDQPEFADADTVDGMETEGAMAGFGQTPNE